MNRLSIWKAIVASKLSDQRTSQFSKSRRMGKDLPVLNRLPENGFCHFLGVHRGIPGEHGCELLHDAIGQKPP